LLLVATSLAAQQFYYRYTNDNGVKVINDILPPEVVPRGYEVINRSGQVVKTVPRQLTAQEREHNKEQLAQQQREAEALAKQQAWDETLLLRYSSVDDIEAARERAMRDMNIRISILRSNLLSVKSEIESEQQRAANLERMGRQAAPDLLEKIEVLQAEIENIEESIAQRSLEKDELYASYQRDIERFTLLLDTVRMRQSGANLR
jgi:hypothetical protein